VQHVDGYENLLKHDGYEKRYSRKNSRLMLVANVLSKNWQNRIVELVHCPLALAPNHTKKKEKKLWNLLGVRSWQYRAMKLTSCIKEEKNKINKGYDLYARVNR